MYRLERSPPHGLHVTGPWREVRGAGLPRRPGIPVRTAVFLGGLGALLRFCLVFEGSALHGLFLLHCPRRILVGGYSDWSCALIDLLELSVRIFTRKQRQRQGHGVGCTWGSGCSVHASCLASCWIPLCISMRDQSGFVTHKLLGVRDRMWSILILNGI